MYKQSFDNDLKFVWATYIIYAYFNFIHVRNFEDVIVYGNFTVAVLMVFVFNIFIVSSARNNMPKILDIDDEKERVILKKLIIYKIFIIINIISGCYLIFKFRTIEILSINLFLVITSFLIHYLKKGYIKTYLYSRQLKYLSQVNFDDENIMNVDTKRWRYKIYFENRCKINKDIRLIIIKRNIISMAMSVMIFIIFNMIIVRLIIATGIMKNLLNIIEAIFNLYTTFDGRCTYIGYKANKNSKDIYEVVITDYINKKEVNFETKYNYDIKNMDHIDVVHGSLTKHVISFCNINLYKKENTSKVSLVPLFIVMIIGYNVYQNSHSNEFIQDEETYYEENGLSEGYHINSNEAINKKLDIEDFKDDEVFDIDGYYLNDNVEIRLDKLYLNDNNLKLVLYLNNYNTDRGMVLNLGDNLSVYKGLDNPESNILTWEYNYILEIDVVDIDKNISNIDIDLEYTMSPYIMNEYLDFDYLNLYPLNVVDNYCFFNINLDNKDVNLEFKEYGEFYNISEDIVKFNK